MTRYVVDASVAVEYLMQSPVGAALASTLDSASIDAPEMLDPEVVSALRRHVNAGLLTDAQAELLIDDLASWPINRISHRFLTSSAWKHRQNVSAYDAMYVATAETVDAPLITADGKLARAPNLGIAVHYVSLT
ncbi:type II toxin-antitoxin system VapC family toxin [Candidatus Poriferisodalis sp.]|uniref:type II toxin-antitoxin system VapC family toxin n=1 Tax=Candidatus Poriferisodalis sp. TaxID=3101277 RepID=UPI003C6F0AAF